MLVELYRVRNRRYIDLLFFYSFILFYHRSFPLAHITLAPARTWSKKAGGERTCTIEVLFDVQKTKSETYVARNLMSIYDKMFKIENNRTK